MSTLPVAASAAPMLPAARAVDFAARWRQPSAAVPLGELADVRITTGPPMIKNENGVLVGYVFIDIDTAQRDLGGWVNDAKAVVADQLQLPTDIACSGPGSTSSSPRWKRA
jgi:copper/silver efflux system protein